MKKFKQERSQQIVHISWMKELNTTIRSTELHNKPRNDGNEEYTYWAKKEVQKAIEIRWFTNFYR